MSTSAPFLPERDGALAAVAELKIGKDGWFSRAVRLGAHRPEQITALAAVVIVGQGVRRNAWTRSAELSEQEVARLAKNDGAAPRALVERSFQTVDDAAAATPMQCTNCSVRPGFGPCPRCVGTGRVLGPGDDGKEAWVRCQCHNGFIPCTMCEGSRRVLRVDVRSIHDTLVPVEQWVVPLAAAEATTALRSLGGPSEIPPYLCPLESAPVESAYRGAASMVTPRFFGFELFDASERARDQLAQLAVSLHVLKTRTYAVPFLLMRYAIGGKTVDAVARRDWLGEYSARLC